MNSDYRIGEWVIRPQHGCIERGDTVVRLKPKPMAVLVRLAQARNAVVRRDELFESVWPGGVVYDATLNQCIAELRRAFGDSALEPTIIKTIPKVGFCLIPEVEPLSAEAPAPKRVSRFLPLATTVAGTMAIAALLFGAWWHYRVAPAINAEVTAIESSPASIAVLPFENMSEEPGYEYFADGLSEELRNLLVKIPQVRVAARMTSYSIRQKNLTVSEIADALHVGHLLEGSVQNSGNRIRVTVHLTEADTGFEVWSEQYETDLDDIFAVQDEIASHVANELHLSLVGKTPRNQEASAEVYALYLQAQYFLNRVTREGRSKAVEKLQQTLALDPDYAPALQALAATYLFQSNSGERPIEEGFAMGRSIAAKAIVIDPGLGSAWGTLAYIESFYDWDWETAGNSVETMLELEPESAQSKYVAASYYQMLGQFERSLQLRDEAILLDPLNPYIYESRAYTLLSMGRYEEADNALQELLEINPSHRNAVRLRAKIRLLRGDPQSALGLLDGLPGDENDTRILFALALRSLGRVQEADAIINSISWVSEGEASYRRAHYYAWAGERDSADEHLNRALQNRYRVLAYVLGEPLLYSIHQDPGWTKALEQLGLLRYWLEVPAEYGGPAKPMD
ncbi:MAG TPA: winged helix-turn-helix domain-containing protein [Xanthomonadales bacterium]|nr:winged helix-turn-helix domain-containing protein [Xanthomonadales bacterium]